MSQLAFYRTRLSSDSSTSLFALGIATLMPALVLFTACVVEPDDFGTISQNAISQNAISQNAISQNAISQNAISQNALSSNVLASGHLQLDTANIDVSTELARSLVKYASHCALDKGDVLSATVDGQSYTFPGDLGVAPAWSYRALNPDEKEAVSACLLAHVNYYEIPVDISIRDLNDDVTADEQATYLWYEASFFGNLFATSQQKYVCGGDPAPDFTQVDPSSAGARFWRRCSDVEDASSDVTMCGFTYVGACDDVCTFAADGSIKKCVVEGQKFQHVTSVWLNDDTEYVTQ